MEIFTSCVFLADPSCSSPRCETLLDAPPFFSGPSVAPTGSLCSQGPCPYHISRTRYCYYISDIIYNLLWNLFDGMYDCQNLNFIVKPDLNFTWPSSQSFELNLGLSNPIYYINYMILELVWWKCRCSLTPITFNVNVIRRLQ